MVIHVMKTTVGRNLKSSGAVSLSYTEHFALFVEDEASHANDVGCKGRDRTEFALREPVQQHGMVTLGMMVGKSVH